eukprot:s1499_g4.t1
MECLLNQVKHIASSDAIGRHRGLFPLPVDWSLGQDPGEVRGNAGVQTWEALVCFSLNLLAGCKKSAPRRRQGAQVTRVLECIRDRISRFLPMFSPLVVSPDETWKDVLSKKISYEGEEFVDPVPLSFEQIEKSLPPEGHGGSVELEPLLVGRTKYLIQHPQEVLLGPLEREPGPNKAQVHIQAGEELRVWELLRQRGVIDWVNLKTVHHDEGGPFLSGLFGVPKAGKFTASGDPLLRVIMNLKPINRAMGIILGDIGELPMATTWGQLVLEEDETILVSQADMSSAFYLFRLPPVWIKFLCFNAKFSGKALGLQDNETYVPGCKVLPMGWSSSVGIMQMASRELMLRKSQLSASELRRQTLAPGWFVDTLIRSESEHFWQVYLDNFMAGEVAPKGKAIGISQQLHEHAVSSWASHGVLCAEDKHVLGHQDATELGVNIQGDLGLLGGGPQRLHKLLCATLILLGHNLPKVKWVQIILGRWIFVLQYRRPAMAILSQSWNYTKAGQDRRRWWPVVQRELSMLVCLTPLLHADLRMSFSPLVSCSDASHFGGAVAVAESLGSAGQQLAHRLGNNSSEPIQAALLVISAFNGIGGTFRGYDLAGIKPAGLIAIEWDRAAQRVTRKAWPNVIEIGDIEGIQQRDVQQWANMFPRVTHVQVTGGFPCVHLSSARSWRLNLEGEGSRLFWNLRQLIDWVRDIFGKVARVDFLVENVLSMDASARAEISRELGVEPYALCPSDILPYNRPRLAWTSWELQPTEGVTFEAGDGFIRVHMTGPAIKDEQWIEPGWHRYDPTSPFATFMKSIPRRRPPDRPAGLNRCDAGTISRWESDSYRFPPYQYKLENLLQNQRGELRYLNPSERELLLGFGLHHTCFAMSASQAKTAGNAFIDKMLSLCGDSFSMLSFGWIISQMCQPWIRPRTPAQITGRLGLAPGAGLAPDLTAPIQRALCYGPNGSTPLHTQDLVSHLSRHVNHTGSDVSLALGTPFSPKVSNHVTLRADWWTWRILFTTRWKFHSHINYLEMKMILQSIQWRARSATACNCRDTWTRRKIRPMPRAVRRPIRKGKSLADRLAARHGISLRGVGIKPKTEQRYNSAVSLLLPILEEASTMDDLDPLCEDWIECQWSTGTPLGIIGDALCAVHFYWPQVQGYLRGAWKLYRNWRRIEVPQRAPPLPRWICRALVGFFLDREQPEMAFLLALGFHTYLRTGEILKLQVRDVHLSDRHGVVTIRRSKTGLRFNIDESVAIYDFTLLRLWELCHLAHALAPSDFVWRRSASAFRKLFYEGLDFFHLGSLGFAPYSIRRGGATHSFQVSQTIESILLRGRWRALNVARLYIEAGKVEKMKAKL